MNDLLQQLLTMGPALGAGVSGNGHAMNAFMEGFQRTQQQLLARKRQQQIDQTAQDDRQRQIERQAAADEEHRVDRATAVEQRKQQDFIQSQQAANTMTQTAGSFDDPAHAKSYIESMMPNLMSVFGQQSMALGQPAVEQAQQVITGRQKKQVSEFVESALKVDHIVNNPDSDPEIQLPSHIQKILGKPTARLSEVQTFAQLPVGKPVGKTRVPAMPGSQEDYITRKYGDNPTPEQMLEGRRAYTDAGREPDKPNANAGVYPPHIQRRVDAKIKGFDGNPIVKKTQTQAEAVSFADSLDINTKNPADDQALIYAFAKAMDPDSVVREGEYNTVQKYSQSWAERFGFNAARVFSNTAFLTPQARQQMKQTIRARFEAGRGQYENLRNEFGRQIERITGKVGGVDELTDYGAAFPKGEAGSKGAAPTDAVVEEWERDASGKLQPKKKGKQ